MAEDEIAILANDLGCAIEICSPFLEGGANKRSLSYRTTVFNFCLCQLLHVHKLPIAMVFRPFS